MRKGFLITITIVLLLSGCSRPINQARAEEEQAISQIDKTIFIMAGKIISGEDAGISSKVSGKVSEVYVDIGSVINKGDALIKLDTRDMEAQVEQAQALVNTAEANLKKVLSGTRPEQLAQAQASLEIAKNNFDNIKKNYDRMKQLLNDGAISQQQFESTEQQYKTYEAQYYSAKQQLHMLSNGETKETVDVWKAQLKQAQASLDYAKLQLNNNGVILSPISGIVSARNINAGEMVSSSDTLMSIINIDTLYIDAYLPSEMLQEVKVGQEVVIKVDELPNKLLDGEISLIGPIVESHGKNVLIKVAIKNPDSHLKPGMTAEIGLKK